MKTVLNRRLEAISAFIYPQDKVIDIGCDHGLLGIDLVLRKKVVKMISSDVRSGPLKIAQANLLKYHMEDKIILKQGDGLATIEDDIDTIVISGMGGITIAQILENINEYPNVQKLILSPNNEWSLVRKKVQKKGFGLQEETIIEEKGKYYLVSVYQKGLKKTTNFFGKLKKENKVVQDYYQSVYRKNKDILKKKWQWHLIKENYCIKRFLKNK